MTVEDHGTVSIQFLDDGDRVLKDFTISCERNTSKVVNTEGAKKVAINISVESDTSSSSLSYEEETASSDEPSSEEEADNDGEDGNTSMPVTEENK